MANKTITANGTTTYGVNEGGRYVFRAAGDFGSGTMTLRWSDGTNDANVPDGALTSSGAIWFRSPTDQVKAILTGATDPDLIIGLASEKQQVFG